MSAQGVSLKSLSSLTKKTRGELQAAILIAQQKIVIHRANSPRRLAVQGLGSVLFAAVVQSLFMMENSPYFQQFSDRLIQYLKESDPILKKLFSQSNYFQNSMKEGTLGKVVGQLESFFNGLEKLGVQVARACEQLNYKKGVYHFQGKGSGTVVINEAVLKDRLFPIIQGCNGGLEGLTEKLITFVKNKNGYRSQYLMRIPIMAVFTGGGVAISLLAEFSARPKQKFSSSHLALLSTEELERQEQKAVQEENELFARNENFNQGLTQNAIILYLLVVAYTVFVDLPAPLIINALAPFIVPIIKHLTTPWHTKYRASQATQNIKQLTEAIRKQLPQNTLIKEFSGPTTSESLLILTVVKYKQLDLQAFSYCLWRAGFVCELEAQTLQVFLTGDIAVFTKDNTFWNSYRQVLDQLRELQSVQKLFSNSEIKPYPGVNLDNELPILCVFIKRENFKAAEIDDPNIRIVSINDGYDDGYELSILGLPNSAGLGYLKKLAEQFKKVEVVAAEIKTQNPAAKPADSKENKGEENEFQNKKSSQYASNNVFRFFSPLSKGYIPPKISAKSQLAAANSSSQQSVYWPSLKLTYDPKNPSKTPNLVPLKFNGRYGSIFVLGNFEDQFEDSLAKKIQRNFEDPCEVSAKNRQGFVFEDGILKLKLLGDDGDTRIHPTDIQRSTDNKVVFIYNGATFNAHKTQNRGQIKRPNL